MAPIVVILGLLLAGCSPKSPPTGPEPASVVLHGFEPRSLDFTGVRGDLLLELTGPEPHAVGALDWDLVVAGVVILSGRADTQPLHDDRLTAPLEVRWSEIEPALDLLGPDLHLHWSLTGTLDVQTAGNQAELLVQGAGTLPALHPPDVSLVELQLRDLDLRNGLALADLLVAFSNPLPLELVAFPHRVLVDDTEVHPGEPLDAHPAPPDAPTEPHPAVVTAPPAPTTTPETEAAPEALLARLDPGEPLALPLSIDLNRLDETVVDALATHGPLTVRLEGTATLRTPYGELPLEIDVESPVVVRDVLEEAPP